MGGWMCKIFDHDWRRGWAGARSGVFGAIVVNRKTCNRCGKEERELTTPLKIKDVGT